MRRSPWYHRIAVAAILAFVLAGCSGNQTDENSTKIETVSQFTPPKGVKPAPLGEIGRGNCWQKDLRPSGGKKAEGFATKTGAKDAARWLKTHKAEAERYVRWLDSYKGYAFVYKLVPDWDELSAVDRVTAYVAKTEMVKLKKPIYVQNTYCRGSKVYKWKVQVLPAGEWVLFVPGYGPETEDPRPVFKAACGNLLLPPGKPKPTPSPTPSTATPHPKCTSCSTPSLMPKHPSRDPNAQNNAPTGGGNNEDQGPGRKKSYTTNPTEPYRTPTPPVKHKPPAGSTPTSHSAPPPEPGANPGNGDANEGDDGGF